MLVILVNKNKIAWFVLILAGVAAFLLYKPCLREYVYPKEYVEAVEQSAEKYGLDPHFVYAVIKAESGFDSQAVSPKGACGLMQITPETAEWIFEKMGAEQKSDIFLPEVNIELGSWYLEYLGEEFGGDRVAVLAAYNAGPANVKSWIEEKGGIDAESVPFAETREYITKTMDFYEKYNKLYPEGE